MERAKRKNSDWGICRGIGGMREGYLWHATQGKIAPPSPERRKHE
jgi:hypothetical protein